MKIIRKETLNGTKITAISDDGITVHTTAFDGDVKLAMKRANEVIKFQRGLILNSGKKDVGEVNAMEW